MTTSDHMKLKPYTFAGIIYMWYIRHIKRERVVFLYNTDGTMDIVGQKGDDI
jgi:hypothetical protein